MNGSESIVEVKNLTITDSATDRVIASNISFELKKGEILGFVGESGSGKTLSMKTVVNLLPSNLVQKAINLLCSETIITKFRKMQKRL